MAIRVDVDGLRSPFEVGANSNEMDLQAIAQRAGLKVVGGEALPSMGSAIQMFTSPPAGARMAVVTIRGNTVTVSGSTTPTAGGTGIDYPAGTYIFPMNESQLKAFQFIQTAAATGWVEYWGLA